MRLNIQTKTSSRIRKFFPRMLSRYAYHINIHQQRKYLLLGSKSDNGSM